MLTWISCQNDFNLVLVSNFFVSGIPYSEWRQKKWEEKLGWDYFDMKSILTCDNINTSRTRLTFCLDFFGETTIEIRTWRKHSLQWKHLKLCRCVFKSRRRTFHEFLSGNVITKFILRIVDRSQLFNATSLDCRTSRLFQQTDSLTFWFYVTGLFSFDLW